MKKTLVILNQKKMVKRKKKKKMMKTMKKVVERSKLRQRGREQTEMIPMTTMMTAETMMRGLQSDRAKRTLPNGFCHDKGQISLPPFLSFKKPIWLSVWCVRKNKKKESRKDMMMMGWMLHFIVHVSMW
ncbi:hypothetical protein F383_05449 [Gossypium arboreum]|uniref:Uncharacterized protein n=1 Tax=Gossypium arboreum TaxID=29729 RepID=A0A0B0N3Y5_GOSAR|nr:hypothetical protein F383_05449 [Gossypium arboreum]